MTLLVADDNRPSLTRILPSDVVTIGTDGVGDAVARNEPDVVVVDANAVADPGSVVETVRLAAPGTTVVVVGAADVDADVTTAATDEHSVRAAVERARRVAEYRESVSELYEACRDRALGRPASDVRERRRKADEQFSDLPDDTESFAALLRTDDARADEQGDAAGGSADAADEEASEDADG